MIAYVYRRGTVVAPLDDDASAAPVANAPLARRQAEALAAARLRVAPAPPAAGPTAAGPTAVAERDGCLLIADDLLLSPAFASRFVAAARGHAGGLARGWARAGRCRVKAGPFFDYFPTPADAATYPADGPDRLYDLYYLPPGAPLYPPAPGEAQDIALTIEVARCLPAYSHSLLAGRTVTKPLTDQYICRVANWPDVMLANVMYLLARRLRGGAGAGPFRGTGGGPLASWRWRRDGVVVRRAALGEGVAIDPFSVVEDSILGDGVKVGSHCRIKGCVIAPGAFICNGANISYSVVGEQAIINTATVNFSLIGRGAHIGSLAVGDAHFDGRTVAADIGGRRVDTRLYILGFACGPGVKVASGLSILPGTAIPAGCHLHSADAVGRVPAGLARGRPLFWLNRQFRDLSLRPAGASDGARSETPAGTPGNEPEEG